MKARQDLDIEAVRAALSGRVIGGRLLHHDVLSSTMDEARLLAGEGWSEGLVVVADEQTAGRGRFDRNWISPPGENLSFSVLLRPTAAELPFVNMAATLAVSKTVAKLVGRPTAIKWPNDVKIGGRKVSGILIETDVGIGKLRYAVLGIGINVNLDPAAHPEIAAIATSLGHELSRRVNRGEVLQSVLERLDEMYGMVKRGRSLTDEWSEQLETLGRSVAVRWGHRVIEGHASAVDERGHLLVVMPDGSTVTVAGGEVTLQV
jgi:BirA family biotin operon repressor/biotin-[acetyl-CoA-carboxylase] ligase